MSLRIDLPEEWGARLRHEAERNGQEPEEYVVDLLMRQLVHRELEALKDRKPPQTLADLKPHVPPPPGESWLASVIGQWPVDESDEEVARILREMS
jgi:hypothetical protein